STLFCECQTRTFSIAEATMNVFREITGFLGSKGSQPVPAKGRTRGPGSSQAGVDATIRALRDPHAVPKPAPKRREDRTPEPAPTRRPIPGSPTPAPMLTNALLKLRDEVEAMLDEKATGARKD